MDDSLERERMVVEQIAGRGIRSPQVLEALSSVPRHMFVPPEYRRRAYDDCPLPIGHGQTISQPYIVAFMTELLQLTGNEKVLEIGTGSGYQAAVLACIVKEVHTIERHSELAEFAGRILRDLKLDNIQVHVGDGTLGLPEIAPFDRILVTAAAPFASQILMNQLADRGRLVIPVGRRSGQVLEIWERSGDRFEFDQVLPVAFVPLIGKEGWRSEAEFDT